MRFAIYYAPEPSSLLHQLGSQWLGRDAFSGAARMQPADMNVADITAEPRRYGFHATLKPPFQLKDQFSLVSLDAAVELLAESFQPFDINLDLRLIDGFLALVPDDASAKMDQLAMACVRDLDGFRQPATQVELARRRAAGLSRQQDANLERWGYPYVFEEFRFHMTLSRRLAPAELQYVLPLARHHFAGVLGRPVSIDALTIFVEHQPGAPFEVHRQFPLQLSPTRAAS